MEEDYQTLEIENHLSDSSKDDNEKHLNGFSDIEKSGFEAKPEKKNLFRKSWNLSCNTQKKKLALYTTDEDLYKLCDYLVVFFEMVKLRI